MGEQLMDERELIDNLLEEVTEVLDEIRYDDFAGATNVKDVLQYNDGWYNYSTLTFDYKGKRFTVEYKEHTSDNVSDMEWLHSTLVCLGDIEVMEETITREELVKIKNHYKRQIKDLEKYRDVLMLMRSLSKKEISSTGEMLVSVQEDSEKEHGKKGADIGTIGNFLIEYSKMRNY